MPDAVAHLTHYLRNSGADYTIRFQQLLNNVPSATIVYQSEIAAAQAFCETLSDGTYDITSSTPSGNYASKAESWNWYYAVGAFATWGKGTCVVCGDEFVLNFEYKFKDRYNWDMGKKVTILGVTVKDTDMGEMHLEGIAKEFDMFGSVQKTITWKRGGAPKVTNGPNDGDTPLCNLGAQ